jgi:coenzyme F420-dependent glucose-6-phosphate dehydrogenase
VTRYGYKASAEQFGPRELLDFSVLAEELGLEIVAVSDHFQPWRHHGGHGPAALTWLGALGERTERSLIGTSVLTPTMRYHPSIVAQSFATLACLNPGRVFLGVGTGEAMNETPATGGEWPGARERRLRLAEAIELIRRLWTDERVTFEGEYYRTERATIYDRPPEPVPIFVAASGPLAAKLAGRAGDGFIATSGKKQELYLELLDNLAEGAAAAGRDAAELPKLIEIKVSYDHDVEYARDACRWWAALSLTPEEKSGVEDPVEMERLADGAADRAHTRFIVSNDPDEVVERIGWYVALGFDHLVFHAPGEDQRRFLEQFCADVLPRLRGRF